MKDNKLNTLDNITELFPKDFTEEQIAKAKTLFYKQFSLKLHQYYGGKMQIPPQPARRAYRHGAACVSLRVRPRMKTRSWRRRR